MPPAVPRPLPQGRHPPCHVFGEEGRFWTIRVFLTYRVRLPAGRGGKESKVEAGTWAPGCPQPGRRSPRHPPHFPSFALGQSERQQTQRAGCQLAPLWQLIFVCAELRRCSVSKESAGGARLPPAPPRPGAAGTGPHAGSCSAGGCSTQHPTLHAGEVLGPADVHGGWGSISVPASSTALPPACFTAVIPEDRKICACFSAAAEQL